MTSKTDKKFIEAISDEVQRKDNALLAIYTVLGVKAHAEDLTVDLDTIPTNVNLSFSVVLSRLFTEVNKLLRGETKLAKEVIAETIID